MKYRTKQGKHGTLYRWAIDYRDITDFGITGTVYYWAYDSEHALDLFYNALDADGWEHVGEPKKLKLVK